MNYYIQLATEKLAETFEMETGQRKTSRKFPVNVDSEPKSRIVFPPCKAENNSTGSITGAFQPRVERCGGTRSS